MNSSSSGEWLERFFTGKGFYIVLFLCAAVIGGSAWMLATGGETAPGEVVEVASVDAGLGQRETDILPAGEETPSFFEEPDLPVSAPQEEAEENVPVFQETREVNPNYAWPLQGEISRFHDPQRLFYDETLGDWRVHEGVDILSPLGETVCAAHAGSVESVEQSDLYGTVVTVNHGDGFCTVYANLAPETAVAAGDWVEPGTVIGTVGQSALNEISQESHLHFAVMLNGVNQDPLDYLPG